MALIDQARGERLAGELCAADRDVAAADSFSRLIAAGSKSRSMRVRALDSVCSVREYTTFSAACQISAKSRVTAGCSPRAASLPVHHRLVHPAPVQVGADRPLEVVDEREQLLVGGRPVERCRACPPRTRQGTRSRSRSAWPPQTSIVVGHRVRSHQRPTPPLGPAIPVGHRDQRSAMTRTKGPGSTRYLERYDCWRRWESCSP